MRTQYNNGDEIGLIHCGCDGCSPSMVNGVLCHEQGCEFSWKDYQRECPECGADFYPADHHDNVCVCCAGDMVDW